MKVRYPCYFGHSARLEHYWLFKTFDAFDDTEKIASLAGVGLQ